MTNINELKSALTKLAKELTPERELYLKTFLTDKEQISLLLWFSGLTNNFESTIEKMYLDVIF